MVYMKECVIFDKNSAMKRLLLYTLLGGIFLLLPATIRAQCTPGDETTCPDPENNGEFCPETLPEAVFEEPYLQDFTILPPPEYVVDSNAGIVVQLHHITLKNVSNLPPGLSWVSNSEDSVFMVGTYYCVLLEGTPTEKGLFPLHIQVDVYVPGILGSPPIFVGTVTDSTTLALNVADPSSVGEPGSGISGITIGPNPFRDQLTVNFTHTGSSSIHFEIYDLLGTRIHGQEVRSYAGINQIQYTGAALKPGMYLILLRDEEKTYTARIIKEN